MPCPNSASALLHPFTHPRGFFNVFDSVFDSLVPFDEASFALFGWGFGFRIALPMVRDGYGT